jgi:predicted deacylase
MQKKQHLLISPSVGFQRSLTSFEFGTPGKGEKIYVQACLHADELPGALVAYHLQTKLKTLELAGRVKGHVVVVPFANPIGLAQTVTGAQIGRFELGSGQNFNRYYPNMFELLGDTLDDLLTHDAQTNVKIIRAAISRELDKIQPTNELDSQRKALMEMAHDADVVIDLHCDYDAVMHIYTGTPIWNQMKPLAAYIGSQAQFLEVLSGGEPFDEACSKTWWLLAEKYQDRFPIPNACASVTIELRGMTAVEGQQAEVDADAILNYLRWRGVIDEPPPELPELLRAPTPLAGSESIVAPFPGVVVFRRNVGDLIEVGDVLVDVIDPTTEQAVTLRSATKGVLYAREIRRYATTGMTLCKIAGEVAFKTGNLLSA